MNPEHGAHIEEQRLIRVLITDVRMTGAENDHLAQCLQCRTVIEDLRENLQALRRARERFTPSLGKHMTLPAAVAAPSRLGGLPRAWRISAGAAASVFLAVVLWWQVMTPPEIATLPAAVTPDPVMLETRILAENAMPATYRAIIESLEQNLDGDFDQGFMDFVIPPLDEESLS